MSASFYEYLSKSREDAKEQDKLEENIRQDMVGRNASLPFYRPATLNVVPRKLNALGWVPQNGKYAGEVFMAQGPGTPGRYANTAGHEGFHERVYKDPWKFPENHYELGGPLHYIKQYMGEVTDPKNPTENWGINYMVSPEEVIAALKGYESSLPQGMSIMDTELGKRVLPRQSLQDMYFNLSSHPHKGIWEGQSQPSALEKVKSFLSGLIKKSGD